MQVFTTIFLAEGLSSNNGTAEESSGHCEDDRELFDIRRICLECIAMLESRNWFVDDLPYEE